MGNKIPVKLISDIEKREEKLNTSPYNLSEGLGCISGIKLVSFPLSIGLFQSCSFSLILIFN